MKITEGLKMVLLFAFLILCLKTSYVYSWLAGKCVFYSNMEDFPVAQYAGKTNYALCNGVTDIKEELQGLPPNILNLNVRMDRDWRGALASYSFSHFGSLETLEIAGCFSEIPPDAFNGLMNVTSLQLSFLHSEGCCEVALDFSHLPSLHSLSISQYSLSLLTLNVFETISQLGNLDLHSVCFKDMSEVLCRLANVKKLKKFVLDESAINRLQYPNCSVFNISDMSTLFNLEYTALSLGQIDHIDEGALKVFQKLNLSFHSDIDFLTDLSLLGVNQISTLNLKVDVLNVDDLCTAAKLFAIESVSVYYKMINFPSAPTNMSHGCKNIRDIVFETDTVKPFHVELFFQIFCNLKTSVIRDLLKPNDLKYICATFPETVKKLSGMSLRLVGNKIVSHQFNCFVNLESLDLSENSISIIEDFSFMGLNKLKKLNLFGNKLSYINQNTFIGLNKLKELNLCRNNLSYIYKNAFSGLHQLMVFDLQENPLIQFEPESFGHLWNLCTLLLGDLNYPPDMSLIKLNLSDIFGIIPYNLSNISISSGLRPMHLVIGSNTTLDHGLNFHIKGQYVIVEDCNSLLLTSVVTLKINAAYVRCENEFIGKYVPSVVSLAIVSMFSDNIGDLAVINQLVHLKTLSLENIDLTNQPNMGIMFHNLTKLHILILVNCKMNFLDGSLTKDLKALTKLVITPKDTVNILQSWVDHLTSLKYVHFQGLGLYCICENAWLVSWVKDNRKVEVIMSNPTMQDLQCLTDNEVEQLNFVSYTKENCSFDIEFMFFACTSVFLCIFIVVVLMYQFVGQYVKPFYHIASGWFREALRLKDKRQYRYDIFASYSGKDEHWVMKELLPNLERRGPPFLRLCLHSRDFQVGNDIVENITDSIYASRRTLCLVSRNYLGSNWCSLEMQLATYRLQVEQRDILILVFLETIPSRLLSSHHRLARLVKTRTYLDWPQDPNMHEAFWDRLWRKLSSNKSE